MLIGDGALGGVVPDVEEAARWYAETLGFSILSPPYLMEGEVIERDMGDASPIPRSRRRSSASRATATGCSS